MRKVINLICNLSNRSDIIRMDNTRKCCLRMAQYTIKYDVCVHTEHYKYTVKCMEPLLGPP